MADDSVSVETLLGELRYPYRRHVLTFFTASETNRIHIDELVEYVSERDDDDLDREYIVVELHHRALPALAEAGIVDYDWEARTVRYREGPRLECALSLLEKLTEDDPCEC